MIAIILTQDTVHVNPSTNLIRLDCVYYQYLMCVVFFWYFVHMHRLSFMKLYILVVLQQQQKNTNTKKGKEALS